LKKGKGERNSKDKRYPIVGGCSRKKRPTVCGQHPKKPKEKEKRSKKQKQKKAGEMLIPAHSTLMAGRERGRKNSKGRDGLDPFMKRRSRKGATEERGGKGTVLG